MAVTAIPVPAPGTSAHRDANVLRWLTAYTASLLGDSVYFVALAFAAAKSVPPAQVGLVMAAGAVPRAALMLGGGVIADRFGPRRVVIGSDALRWINSPTGRAYRMRGLNARIVQAGTVRLGDTVRKVGPSIA